MSVGAPAPHLPGLETVGRHLAFAAFGTSHGFHRHLAAFHALPAALRDAGYRFVARHRYKLFGASDTCRAPTERFKSRFLEYEPELEFVNKF